MRVLIVLAVAAAFSGCSSTPASPHVVSGTVEQRTFATPIDQVAVVRAGAPVVIGQVTPAGEFSLTIPPGSGYRLELTSPADRSGLVNPRVSGVLDATFAVRGGGAPFSVGLVRSIGTTTGVTFHYGPAAGECEDGKTASGQVCVDDQQAESCNEGDSGGSDGETNDGETDGEPADGETNDDGNAPASASVADHNIPSSIGCGDGGDSGGDHQNEGDEQGDH